MAVDGAGTVECLTPIYDSIPDIDVMRKGYFSVVPYAVPGKYVAYAFSYTGGALIQWCMETFGRGENYDSMEAACSGDEPTRLLVLPHFAGAATPYMDTGSKGAILGLTTSTTAGEIYRACMEGVAYALRHNLETAESTGARAGILRAMGGSANSRIWTQIKADVTGRTIQVPASDTATTLGAAILAGVGCGLYKDYREAVTRTISITKVYEPDMSNHEIYRKNMQLYLKLYEDLKDTFKQF